MQIPLLTRTEYGIALAYPAKALALAKLGKHAKANDSLRH